MSHKLHISLLVLTSFALLMALPVLGHDNDNPAIAILRFGGSTPDPTLTEITILDMLETYGFISAEEKSILEGRNNHEGDKVTVIWGDAHWDLATASLMIDNALDHDVDVLVTLTTPVTQIAVNTTVELDAPPPVVLFASVYNPYAAGIAQSTCVKPAHVTGTEILTPYEDIISLLRLQDPDMATIGTLYNSSETSGTIGAERITDLAESHGLTVVQAAVTGLADLNPAMEGLVNKGAEAIVLPIDSVTAQGLPTIAAVASENGIMVFYPSLGSVYHGATIGAGFYLYDEQGASIARMLTAYLNGELDIAATGIDVQRGIGIGVNLDTAEEQGIEISPALLEQVDVVIEDGHLILSPELQALAQRGRATRAMEDRLADDRAYLEYLRCSPEMIAEQQAALSEADA